MRNGELQEWLALWPSDAEIVSRGEDGIPCTDVHHDTVDEPLKSWVNGDKVVLFIHALGPGDLPPDLPPKTPEEKPQPSPYIGWPQEGYHNDKLEPFDTTKYEYTTTENQRKCNSIPPAGEGWQELDWIRWDYTEDVFWRRLRQPLST